MAEDNTTPSPSDRSPGPGRGHRQGGNRDSGGLRIRLSDNEMRAARALQDAFGLRSTVAVLGFSLRTLAQQLEQGQLEDLVQQHRSQAGSRPPGRGGERRRDRSEGYDGPGQRGPRIDPFARPSRPPAAAVSDQEEPPPAPEHEESSGEPVASAPPTDAMESGEPSAATAGTLTTDSPEEQRRPLPEVVAGGALTESESGA